MHSPLVRSLTQAVKGLGLSLFAALLLAAPAIAQTQITTGTIQGVIQDANGAALPGATVELKNIDTNLMRTTTSDEDGRFIAPQLPSGRYSLTVSKTGFATLVVEKADLTVGQA